MPVVVVFHEHTHELEEHTEWCLFFYTEISPSCVHVCVCARVCVCVWIALFWFPNAHLHVVKRDAHDGFPAENHRHPIRVVEVQVGS